MDDKVEMKYQGPNQGRFAIVCADTGNRYEIAGRGDQFFVDPADAAWLEQTFQRYGQEYIRVVRQKGFSGEPIFLPSIDFSALPVETTIPDVTLMTPKEAIKAIAAMDNEPDLRVVEALENGTEARPKVLEAIAKRREDLHV